MTHSRTQVVDADQVPLDPDQICRRGHAFADTIEACRDALTEVLVEYETHQVARDEIARTLDLARSLEENRGWFRRRIGEVASFLPCNQPLYALARFGLIPALMSRKVHVRPPRAMGRWFEPMLAAIGVRDHFPELAVSHQDRASFLAERSAVAPAAVIFTGNPDNATRVREHFDDSVLFIMNGTGHNPVVVTESANLERAVAGVVRVQLHNQGQDGASPSSILVHASVYPQVVARLREAVAQVRVGSYRDADVIVGPISRPADLARIQALLADNARWLDHATPGVIRTAASIVEPTIVLRPLASGGNFTEQLAPIFFVQRYDDDPALARYFEDPRYPPNAMYVTVYGHSPYADGLVRRSIAGRVLHDDSTIVRDTDLHAPGVARGTRPYGGFGTGASYRYQRGITTVGPTLPQRDLDEQLIGPAIGEQGRGAAAPPGPDLEAEARYLDAAVAPIHRADTRIELLVDGLDYFASVADAIRRTRGAGDVIYILAFQFDPGFRIPGEPSGASMGELLAAKAACGVDVRLVLEGTPLPTNPWRANGAAARVLTRLPALAGRVRVDRTGFWSMRTEHQKTVIVLADGELTGHVTGMDPVPDHWDRTPHGSKRWPDGTVWGWHDLGAKVRGTVLKGMWDNFCDRWRRAGGGLPPIGPCPPISPVTSTHSVQLLRARYQRGAPLLDELHRAMRHAIAMAERYIYVEDQWLCDHLTRVLGVNLPVMPYRSRGFSLFDDVAARIRERPELKVVFVGSGKSDPLDFHAGPRNRRFTPSLRRMLDALSPAQRGNVAVWRVEDVTIHSKVVLIDDRFAALGSANFRARSMKGVDTELQLAFTAGDDTIPRLRTNLWAEHHGLEPIERTLLGDLDRALGIWHPAWPRGVVLPSARRRQLMRVMD